jgi:hypothetical protein
MKLKCVVYSISEGKIINYNYEILTENLPIQGLDPDLKVYGFYYTNTEPPYDSRTQTLNIIQNMVESPHPVYGTADPNLLTYQVTYDLERKTDEELYFQVGLMEAWANNELLPAEQGRLGKQQRNQKILHKKIKGLSLEQWEEDLIEEMDTISDAMDQNSDNADQIKDYIDANPTLIPDLDSGWITSIE